MTKTWRKKVFTYLSVDEKAAAKATAESTGQNVSAWIRGLVVAALKGVK